MSKFPKGTKAKDIGAKVGDKFRVLRAINSFSVNDIITLEEDDGSVCPWFTKPKMGRKHDCILFEDLELVNEGEKTMNKRTFKLIKETVTIKKGALYQEQCDDGTQPYQMITPEFDKRKGDSRSITITDRSLVEDQPQWFVEVFKVTPEYMTQEELDRWESFKKGGAKQQVKIAKVKKSVVDATYWTPERRKAQSRKMKKIRAARKGNWGTK